MPLLECGRIVSDPWQKLADEAALPSGPCIVNLSRLQQDEVVRTEPHLRLGVVLPVDQPAEGRARLYSGPQPSRAARVSSRDQSDGQHPAGPVRVFAALWDHYRRDAGRFRPCGMAESGGPLLLRLSALRTQRAGPVRPSPNDTTWRAAQYLIALDRKIESDPATTQNKV